MMNAQALYKVFINSILITNCLFGMEAPRLLSQSLENFFGLPVLTTISQVYNLTTQPTLIEKISALFQNPQTYQSTQCAHELIIAFPKLHKKVFNTRGILVVPATIYQCKRFGEHSFVATMFFENDCRPYVCRIINFTTYIALLEKQNLRTHNPSFCILNNTVLYYKSQRNPSVILVQNLTEDTEIKLFPTVGNISLLKNNRSIRLSSYALFAVANNFAHSIDATSGSRIQSFIAHPFAIKSLEHQPNSNLLATGSVDGSWMLWDVNDTKSVNTIRTGNPINALTWAPNNQHIATAHDAGMVAIWDIRNLKQTLAMYKSCTSEAPVKNITYHPNGAFLVASTNGQEIHFLSCDTHSCKKVLYSCYDSRNIFLPLGNSLEFSPDGTILFADWDSAIKYILFTNEIQCQLLDTKEIIKEYLVPIPLNIGHLVLAAYKHSNPEHKRLLQESADNPITKLYSQVPRELL